MPSPPATVDRAGFPMTWIEPLGAYLHWLPVTKVQFEYFLCDRPSARFDQDWYDALLRLNRRISPRQIDGSNYWHALLTGITPPEAQAFAQWCGDDGHGHYRLPTAEEWFKAYSALRTEPPLDLAAIEALELSPRARLIVQKLDAAVASVRGEGGGRTMADQMLMRHGVMEWVECKEGRSPFGAYGRPNKQLEGRLINLEAGQMSIPNDLEQRLVAYGFRLLRRGE